jgi:hypothetical protein
MTISAGARLYAVPLIRWPWMASQTMFATSGKERRGEDNDVPSGGASGLSQQRSNAHYGRCGCGSTISSTSRPLRQTCLPETVRVLGATSVSCARRSTHKGTTLRALMIESITAHLATNGSRASTTCAFIKQLVLARSFGTHKAASRKVQRFYRKGTRPGRRNGPSVLRDAGTLARQDRTRCSRKDVRK